MLIAPASPGPGHPRQNSHTPSRSRTSAAGRCSRFRGPQRMMAEGRRGFPAGGFRPPRAGSGGGSGSAELWSEGAAARRRGRGRWSCFPWGQVAPEGTGWPELGLRSRHPTGSRRQPSGRSLPRSSRHSPGLTQPLPRRPSGALDALAAPRCAGPRAPGSSFSPELWSPLLLLPKESRHSPPRRAGDPGRTAPPGAGVGMASAPARAALVPGCLGG